MEGENRIGTVSNVDKTTGMVSVIYNDRDGEVTQLLPYATFNDEYKLPKIGENVLVIHLSNGKEMGIVLGTYWNEKNVSEKTSMYYKKISENAFFDYDGEILSISAEFVKLTSLKPNKSFEVSKLMEEIEKIKERISNLEKKI